MISHISKVVPISVSSPQGVKHAPADSVVANVTTGVSVPPVVSTAGQDGVALNGGKNNGGDSALVAAVEHLNTNIQSLNRNLEFSIDEGSGAMVVKVVDADTKEVIRQIPREEVLALAQHLKEYEKDHSIGLLQAEA